MRQSRQTFDISTDSCYKISTSPAPSGAGCEAANNRLCLFKQEIPIIKQGVFSDNQFQSLIKDQNRKFLKPPSW